MCFRLGHKGFRKDKYITILGFSNTLKEAPLSYFAVNKSIAIYKKFLVLVSTLDRLFSNKFLLLTAITYISLFKLAETYASLAWGCS